jgi:hypothetical protein
VAVAKLDLHILKLCIAGLAAKGLFNRYLCVVLIDKLNGADSTVFFTILG